MQQRYSRLLVCGFLACIFLAVSAHAYEILLDIDIDNDPSTINISTEAVVNDSIGPVDAFGGMAVSANSGKLFVGDRNAAGSGIMVFSTTNDSLLRGPMTTGLPPNGLAIVTVQ